MGKEIDNALIEKSDIKIIPVDPKELKERDQDVPVYKAKLDLTEGQIKRLRTEVFGQFEILDQQRKSNQLDDKWDDLDAQYDGEMDDNDYTEFDLDYATTQIKVDALVRLVRKALLKSDPKYSVTARPEAIKQGKEKDAQMQEDYLDYLYDDEINLKGPLGKVLHSAAVKGTGILKLIYEFIQKPKKREEYYEGGEKGAELFLQNYPNSNLEGDPNKVYYEKIKSGEEQYLVVAFKETVYNNPKPSYVDLKNFWVDIDTEEYEGLCEARTKIEQQEYSWWELKRMEANGDFENVDKMKEKHVEGDEKVEKIENVESIKHKIFETVHWFDIDNEFEKIENPNPENEVRIVCWFARESKAFLGATLYPYFLVESEHIPFHFKNNKSGFYQEGIAEDLTDTHLAQNLSLNLMLTGAHNNNTITPIVREGSEIAQQFLSKRFTHGRPIIVPNSNKALDADLDFLDRPQVDTGELSNIMLFLSKLGDDQSSISSLASGKETPTDPRAPAAKTAMLLRQTGVNIEDYIEVILPSFNQIGVNTLQLVYQMSRQGRIFRQRKRAQDVVGGNPFAEITRDQMITKTNIQSQAAGFNFDKINEKTENLALYQLIRTELERRGDPKGIYELVRTLIKSWSPLWKNKVDQIWPDPEEFNRERLEFVINALGIYLKSIEDQQKTTGIRPDINVEDFMSLFTQLQQQSLSLEAEEENA